MSDEAEKVTDAGADKGADQVVDKTIDKAADKGAETLVGGADKAADAGGDKAADKGADAATPDWRSRMAGEDAAFLKRLGRFPDEATFAKSYRSLEQKLSSGEFKKALPEGATDEEKATWRKENGLPDKAEAYIEKLALPNGLVIGEADKPVLGELAAAALAGNVDPAAFNGIVAKYYEIQDAARIKQEDADATFKQASDDALREAWQGPDYRRNLTAVNNLLATWPDGLASSVLAGRTPDGRLLGNDPVFIKQLASLATELNPHATLVPAGTTDPKAAGNARLEEIRSFRRSNPDGYDADKKMQAEELELITANQKVQSRAA